VGIEARHGDARPRQTKPFERPGQHAQQREHVVLRHGGRHVAHQHVLGDRHHAQRAADAQQPGAGRLQIVEVLELAGQAQRRAVDGRHDGGLHRPGAAEALGARQPVQHCPPAGSRGTAEHDLGRIEREIVQYVDDAGRKARLRDVTDGAQGNVDAAGGAGFLERREAADQQRAADVRRRLGKRLQHHLGTDAAGITDHGGDDGRLHGDPPR
jgi:hypothetical protein